MEVKAADSILHMKRITDRDVNSCRASNGGQRQMLWARASAD